MNEENFQKIKKNFTDRVMVVMKNQPEVVYQIEKKIERMIAKGVPNDEI